MKALIAFWQGHGTKLLGTLQTIVAGLITIPGLIEAADLPYWGAANVILAALTINRGFTNTRNTP